MRWPVSRRARRSAKIAKTTVNLPANRTATGDGDAAAAAAADAIGTSAIATATTGMMSKAAMNSSRTANSRRPISNPSLGAQLPISTPGRNSPAHKTLAQQDRVPRLYRTKRRLRPP